MCRIVIVEDQRLMATALEAWLARERDFVVVGNAADGEAGWVVCQATLPDLALLDIEIPRLDGLRLAQRLKAELPETRILIMSGLMDPYTIWQVGQSGVHGYIEKTNDMVNLTEIIRTVAAGDCFFSPTFQKVQREWLSRPEAFQKVLSDREQEVLKRVASGWDDGRLADVLGISVSTVGVHRKHIRQKLALHNDRELMTYARLWGLG
jgi:DNA-binding NarL/FixJ family response regulator